MTVSISPKVKAAANTNEFLNIAGELKIMITFVNKNVSSFKPTIVDFDKIM